jgi:hypothetical protein
MNKNIKRSVLTGLIGVIGLVLPLLSTAQDVTIIPSLRVSGEYNDNVLFTGDSKKDDFIFNFTPGFGLDYATDVLDLKSSALIRFREYYSENELDRDDQYVNLYANYRLTERARLIGRGYYLKDFTLESALVGVDDPLVAEQTDKTGLGIEKFYSERKRYSGFAALNYQLTERSDLQIRYSHLKTDYDFEENTDYDLNIVGLTFLRRLQGQKDKIGTRLLYMQNDSETNDADTYELGLIWNHVFTETMDLYTNVGARYTEQTSKDDEDDEGETNNWSGTADIRLRRLGDTNTMNIGFRQSLESASSGRSVNVSRLYLDLRQELREKRLFFDLRGDFYITKEDSDSSFDEDSEFLDIIPSLRYMLTENHSVRLAYSYTIEYDKSRDDNRDTQRNRIWVAFELVFPQKY